MLFRSTFTVHTDEDSGQTVISGMGELHLDIIVDRLRREFGVEINQGAPQVNYKEALTKTVQHQLAICDTFLNNIFLK